MPNLKVAGIHIDYREAGQGETVILIHSSASGLGQWRKLMEALAPRYRAIAYNLFGCGETTPWMSPQPQTLADQAQLVLALADFASGGAQAGNSVHLVGHSFGGSVAMKAALSLGARVSSLLLLEPIPLFLLPQHGCVEAYAESCALRDHMKRHGAAGEWEQVAERFADYWNAPGAWAAMSPERRQTLLKLLPSSFHEWDAVMGERTPMEAWADFAARTTVITAKNTMRPTREIAELMTAHLGGLRWEQIPEGGHMAPLTRPDLVNPLVLAHLERFGG